MTEIYENIKRVILEHGYSSVSAFGKEFSIAPATFTDIKSGRCKPSYSTLQKIADALGVSIDALTSSTVAPSDDAALLTAAAEKQNALFEKRRLLFDLSAKATEEDLDFVTRLVQKLVGDE